MSEYVWPLSITCTQSTLELENANLKEQVKSLQDLVEKLERELEGKRRKPVKLNYVVSLSSLVLHARCY